MSPTLLNTKYDLGENRTHDTAFLRGSYRVIYPLSQKAMTHSTINSSYEGASA